MQQLHQPPTMKSVEHDACLGTEFSPSPPQNFITRKQLSAYQLSQEG